LLWDRLWRGLPLVRSKPRRGGVLALGITAASFVTDMQGFQLVLNGLVMPIFFLSGCAIRPRLLRALAAIAPLSYRADGVRTLLIHASHFGIATDVTVLSTVAITFLGFGGYRFTRLEV
jgi:ABC-2 type transport system permease protein